MSAYRPRSERLLSRRESLAGGRCYLCGEVIEGCMISGDSRYGVSHPMPYLLCGELAVRPDLAARKFRTVTYKGRTYRGVDTRP